MGLIIDTCVLIRAERVGADWARLLVDKGDEPVGISVITASELLHGVHRADNREIRMKRASFVEAILESIPVHHFDLKSGRLYAELWSTLQKRGQTVDTHDLQIAATAISLGFNILTYNKKDFVKIPGLKVVTPI